ncbi:MAG: carboxylesterase family protein, partial [Proteobacteria bacterium]|nr:carboxylesterase family protein [Pseudomonadota bacterium]
NTMETGETHVNDIILKLLVNDGSAANQTEAESILNTKTDTEIEDYLRAKDGYEILSAYDGNPFTGMIEFPYFFQDGTVIPEAGLDVFDTGAYNKVPVIIGNTKEETKMFMFGRPDLLSLDDAIYQIIATYDSDMIKAAGVDTFARKLESHTDQPAVYAYQFQWGQWKGEVEKSVIPEPNGSKIGACHGMDVSFFMGNDTFYGSEELTSWVFNEENRISRKALSSAILAYVAQFARTGNPNGSDVDLPEWEQWSNDEGQPKSILLDADLSGTLDIRMSDVELTNQGIKDDLCSKRTEEFYSDAYNFLISDAYDFMGYDTYDFIGWECNE